MKELKLQDGSGSCSPNQYSQAEAKRTLIVNLPYGIVEETRTEAAMENVVFVGKPHKTSLYEDAGFRCSTPATGRLVERVLAERRRCRLIAMTQETFSALPSWLADDFLKWTPDQVVIVPELPITNTEERQLLGDILREGPVATSSTA